VNWLLKLDPLNPQWGTEKYYMVGNVMEGFDYEKDNWKAFFNGKDVEKQVRVDKPIYPSYVKEESAHDAYERVLAGAGAIFPKRDVIDTRIVEEVKTGQVTRRDAYLKMLAAGSSKPPIDLLKEAGVDMTTSVPFNAAIAEMNATMDEMEKVLDRQPKPAPAKR